MVIPEKHGGLGWSLRLVHRCKGSSSDGNTCRTPHRHPRAWVVALPDRLQDMEDPGLDRTSLPVRGLLPLGDPRWQYAAFPGQRDADRGQAALPGVQAPAVD